MTNRTLYRFRRVWLFALLAVILLVPALAAAQDEGYAMPEDPAGLDNDLVIASVGSEEITLGEFRERVRLERWQLFTAIAQVVNENGESVLDIESQTNPFAQTLSTIVTVLADDELLGQQIYDVMLSEALYRSEASARELEVDVCEVDGAWSQLLNIDAPVDCQPASNYAAAKAEFLTVAGVFSGATEASIEASMIGIAARDAVRADLAETFTLPEVAVARTRHIRLDSLEAADVALERINEGEDFLDVMADTTIDANVNGNGGDLGYFSSGQMVPPFEEAAFAAEVGEVVGPVQSDFGYHVIEVLDRSGQVRARHILVATEEEANAVLERLSGGEDFTSLAQELSTDTGSGQLGGDLGFFGRGRMVAPFEEAAFGAEIGEVVGPIQSEFGYHIIEVTDRNDEVTSVNARHILLETEEEANAVIERISGGEEFADLARELSIDPSAKGSEGDTLTIATGGQQAGLYSEAEMLPEIATQVFTAEVGTLLGPIETQFGFFILEVLETGTREASGDEIEQARGAFVDQWETDQLDSDTVTRTDMWKTFVPHDPLPSDVSALLAPIDVLLLQASTAE